jgi:hypothetical protein
MGIFDIFKNTSTATDVKLDPNAQPTTGNQLNIGGQGQANSTLTITDGTQQVNMQGQAIPPSLPFIGGQWPIVNTSIATSHARHTPEEQAELAILESDRQARNKQAKMDVFKALSAEARQRIINVIEDEDAVSAIVDAEAPRSQRQIELENRPGNYILNGSISINNLNWTADLRYSRKNEFEGKGITINDLKSAHADMLMDEELRK